MAEQQWVITVAEEHRDRIGELAQELEAAGLRIDRVLNSLGQIIGGSPGPASAESSLHSRIASTAGVASVDAAQTFRIGPPDSGVQ
ncbi:hypothetical protein [Nesterenkonia alkaliphila]|uniref:Ketohydroxyglutarate aldolase n=1 Tax=Nesterenkonia alkaliphila TaxID=1463631 RepID=A0A7K1UFG1_9MICC|nr:hypothetical protein [Nesterenkonia alkaliphila]MVT24821.1 hypothetical protein [Nesterenkonia alkaliphila]GFZ93574.1 hypothetical protein GCM10011359_23780 [Nesterenkonia alkaliphila]